MKRTYLQCDLCGDKWDITFTEMNKAIYPGWAYTSQCIKDGKRKFIIKTGTYTDDGRVEMDDIDICDKCYNALDRFLFSLGEEEENGEERSS
jgi:hypothetical protein